MALVVQFTAQAIHMLQTHNCCILYHPSNINFALEMYMKCQYIKILHCHMAVMFPTRNVST